MPVPTVSTDFMQAVFDYLDQHGIRPAEVLTRMALQDQSQMIVNDRVPLHFYEKLLVVAEALTDDPHIGLHVGATPLPQSWGLVSYLAMTAPNALMALNSLMKYSVLQLDFGYFKLYDNQTLESDPNANGYISLTWESDFPRLPHRHVVEHLYANVTVLAKKQIGFPFPTLTIHFQHEETGDPAHVAQVLNADILYGQETYKTYIPKEFLEHKATLPQEELFHMAGSLAKEQLRELRNDDRLISVLRSCIVERLPYGLPKLEDIAAHMDIAPRTLQRRLKERNFKYQQLLDDIRRELALDIIKKPNYSLNDIADYLGFNDQSAFQRAFKRWEGITPGKFRSNLQLY